MPTTLNQNKTQSFSAKPRRFAEWERLTRSRCQKGWGGQRQCPFCCRSAGVFGCSPKGWPRSEPGGHGDGSWFRTDAVLDAGDKRVPGEGRGGAIHRQHMLLHSEGCPGESGGGKRGRPPPHHQDRLGRVWVGMHSTGDQPGAVGWDPSTARQEAERPFLGSSAGLARGWDAHREPAPAKVSPRPVMHPHSHAVPHHLRPASAGPHACPLCSGSALSWAPWSYCSERAPAVTDYSRWQ